MIDVLDVVVADDHYVVREGVRQLLDLEPDLTVVATAADAVDLLRAVEEARPHAVVTDIRMPPGHDTEGIAAALAIRRRHPETGVVVLSAHADAAYALELFADGPDGLAYLLKDRISDREQLAQAVRATAAGGSVIDPHIVNAMLRRGRSALSVLTPREREVLAQMATGRSNPAIGRALYLSVSAVEKHITAIFAKLGLSEEPAVHRRVAAVLTFLSEN